jgi:hypothetical protein
MNKEGPEYSVVLPVDSDVLISSTSSGEDTQVGKEQPEWMLEKKKVSCGSGTGNLYYARPQSEITSEK